ncbi:MAG: L-aspartate oxidase, partial [Acidimicrobiales bacterium]
FLVERGRCTGVLAVDPLGELRRISAGEVVLASGGAGQLFSVTTNPREATGDGIAMAIRAGVPVADCEFVQFHPTALHHPAMPRPLVSEALRGHGAVLRGDGGRRFVEELAPRDVVSRAIAREMAASGRENVWLDCTGLEDFARRFPTIWRSLAEVGLDPSRDWLPVAPAAHHLSGGILTDLDGATAMPGLWAAGETACSGVHGANRLASNSLLEGMVFGARVVEAISAGSPSSPVRGRSGVLGEDPTIPLRQLEGCTCGTSLRFSGSAPDSPGTTEPRDTRSHARPGAATLVGAGLARLQAALTANAGVVRDGVSLKAAEAAISEVEESVPVSAKTVAGAELANLLTLARAVVESASHREESRGAHTRSDFEDTSADFLVRLVHGPKR